MFIAIVHTQIVPPDIQFKNIETNWMYISEDTNFIKSETDKWSSPFWGRNVTQIEIVDNKMYLVEDMFAQSPHGGYEGGLLHKIDMESGEADWI